MGQRLTSVGIADDAECHLRLAIAMLDKERRFQAAAAVSIALDLLAAEKNRNVVGELVDYNEACLPIASWENLANHI